MGSKSKKWWQFVETDAGQRASGTFRARGFENVGRLYYPICNEAGMLSSVTPLLQGSPTAGQNMFLGHPLSAEDLPHSLVHRDFWLAEKGKEPFSLSGCSPDGLRAHLKNGRSLNATVECGPGWFSLERSSRARGLRVKATLWCPANIDEKVECMAVEVTNTSKRALTLHPYGVLPLYGRSADNLRDHRHVSALLHRNHLSTHGVTVCPTMSFDERGHQFNNSNYVALGFGINGKPPVGIWGTQESFLGEGGHYAAPRAVWNLEAAPTSDPDRSHGREALGGFRFAPLKLAPGKTVRYLMVSGISDQVKSAARWARMFSKPGWAERSLAATRAHWKRQLGRVVFQTHDSDLNNWLTWVGYQPILRQIYGNSFLPEFDYGRGGKGWRDLWQDCLALLLFDPGPARDMLLHNFGGVRIDGSNATIIGNDGGFIADRNNIPRTWMDHGTWPTLTTLLYIDQSGDLDFLLEEREYFRDPQLRRCRAQDDTWTEAYGNALRTRQGKVYQGTLLEHMLIQNVTAFFNVGEHNLCRLEGADWNDGLDMAEERGESVAFSAFYAWNLDRLAQLVETLAARGLKSIALAEEVATLLDRLPGAKRVRYDVAAAKSRRLDAYLDTVANDVSGRHVKVSPLALVKDLRAKSRDLSQRISEQEWVDLDKRYSCFNGYYDNKGQRVEGRHAKGPRMILTGQVFPLMAGIATEEQIDAVMRSVRKHLYDPRHGGVRLNTDFRELQPGLGRAFSFQYGEKENGAVFSHMAVMYSCALYQRRRAKEGRHIWSTLYRMAMDEEAARIFPCIPEYFNADGRGMYCYLTGSASWFIYLMLTQVYGVRGEQGDLVLDPQLTPEDFGSGREATVRTGFAGRRLALRFLNPDSVPAGKYKVERVAKGRTELDADKRPEGGVRIAREVIEALPASRETSLTVHLVKA